MSEWYYATNGERFGPMPMTDLQRAATDGKFHATDRAWTDGWPDWRPATDVPGLNFPDVPTPVGYAAGGLPARAAETFKKFAPPTGDTGAWPLGEAHLDTFAEAGRHRRRVRRARGLYRLLAVLHLLFGALVAGLLLKQDQTAPAVVAVVGGGGAALALLYGLAARATRRNFRWGGIVGVVLILADLAFCGVIVASVTNRSTSDRGQIVGIYAVIMVLLAGGLFVAARGLSAVRQFRASPAWCQEAILRGEMRRRARD